MGVSVEGKRGGEGMGYHGPGYEGFGVPDEVGVD